MRQSIHHNYSQLTEAETAFVDEIFREVHTVASLQGIPLAGDDRVERAVDALARAVIESRPKAKPRIRIKAGRDPEVIAAETAANEAEEQRLEDIAHWKYECQCADDIDPSLKAH